MSDHTTIKALRRGETVEIDGFIVKQALTELSSGDLYVAERNTGPHLLTCQRVNSDGGYVVPEEVAYCFDISECVKIEVLQV